MKKNINLPQTKFRIDGYSYKPIESSRSDVFSIQHLLVQEDNGMVFEPDFTPYCYMSRIDVQNFLYLGMPKRLHEYRPLSSDDLRKMTNSTNR